MATQPGAVHMSEKSPSRTLARNGLGPALAPRSRLAIKDWDTMGTEDRMKGKRVQAGSRRGQAAVLLSVALAGGALLAQTAGKSAPVDPSASADRALKLVGQGRCKEALPILQRAMPRLTDKDLRYHAAMGLARCAMARQDMASSMSRRVLLKPEFPVTS